MVSNGWKIERKLQKRENLGVNLQGSSWIQFPLQNENMTPHHPRSVFSSPALNQQRAKPKSYHPGRKDLWLRISHLHWLFVGCPAMIKCQHHALHNPLKHDPYLHWSLILVLKNGQKLLLLPPMCRYLSQAMDPELASSWRTDATYDRLRLVHLNSLISRLFQLRRTLITVCYPNEILLCFLNNH